MDTALADQAPTTTTPSTEKKAIFTLTAKAVDQVKEVMKGQGYEGYTLTVRVVPAGCSGLGYDLNLMREGKPGDILFEQDGIKIATDPVSVKYLSGTQIDYQVNDTTAGFKFENPNAKSGCGCGSSFSV